MKWWAARWFLAGIGTAVVLGAAGSVIVFLRRGVMLADEEASFAYPIDEKAESGHGARKAPVH